MADYDVGYGKTPKHSRYQQGVSGNPKGRPKRSLDPLGEVVQGVFDAPVTYREGGLTKTAPMTEVRLRMLRKQALEGSVSAADSLLEEYHHACKRAGTSPTRILVSGGLTDLDEAAYLDMAEAVPAGGSELQPSQRG
jgi:hypothetical protein